MTFIPDIYIIHVCVCYYVFLRWISINITLYFWVTFCYHTLLFPAALWVLACLLFFSLCVVESNTIVDIQLKRIHNSLNTSRRAVRHFSYHCYPGPSQPFYRKSPSLYCEFVPKGFGGQPGILWFTELICYFIRSLENRRQREFVSVIQQHNIRLWFPKL